MLCPKCGSYMDVGAKTCPVCGAKVDTETINDATPTTRRRTPTRPTTDMPMKWFKFLIYFALWAGGVVYVVNGVGYLTGTVYMVSGTGFDAPDLVYAAFPRLRTIDICYGLILLACGVFMIYTRYRLAGFRADGPMCLYISYAVTTAASVVYEIFIANIIGDLSIINSIATPIAGAALWILFNRVYFQRRADLFVN